jgi:hypothetical protein
MANAAKNNIKQRKRTRAKVRAFRIACVDRGETNPLLLDFDHMRDKRANISQLVQSGMSWTTIKDEIANCEVRCANCHARKTAREIRSYRTKAV